MNLNSENKQVVHEVLIADMQKRLYEDGKGIIFEKDNEYAKQLETLVDSILHTNSIPNNKNIISLLVISISFIYLFVYTYFMFVWPHVSPFLKTKLLIKLV